MGTQPIRECDEHRDDHLPYDTVDPYALDSSNLPKEGRGADLKDPYEPQPTSFASSSTSSPRNARGRNGGVDRASYSESRGRGPRGRPPRRGVRTYSQDGQSSSRGMSYPHSRQSPPRPPPPQQQQQFGERQFGNMEIQPPVAPDASSAQAWTHGGYSLSENVAMFQRQHVAPHINPLFANAFAYMNNYGYGVLPAPGYAMQPHYPSVPEINVSQQHPYSNSNSAEYTIERERFE